MLIIGCANPSKNETKTIQASDDDAPLPSDGNGGANATPSLEKDREATGGATSPGTNTISSGKPTLILGRSVARGRIDYMGGVYVCYDEACDNTAHEANYDGKKFIYSELDSPPDIIATLIDRLDRFGDKADTGFFKLCFVDFASDPSGENLQRNKGYVEAAYNEIVVKRHKRMIVGNALPSVASATDADLIANHRAYNAWLVSFAASHKDVKVLDLYGLLSGSDGALRPEYAYSSDDSHPNSAGYAKITPEFLKLLG